MARTITDEEIKLSIIINGNPAQKQLLDLEKATRKLTEENKALNVERRRLEAQGKKDTDQYKALTATIKANSIAIDNNKASMKELQNQIGITGLSIGQLRDKANQLRMTLKNLIPDSPDFKKFDAELKQVNARLGELTGKAQASKFSISSIADGFNKYQALAFSLVATFTGVVLSIQKVIDMNGKLSDAQADVMKTTGMTKDEVDELTKSFGALETRTSRIDLLKIAEQGGRIGIAKADIQDFVKNMNMANVALGDSFTGGVEEVANKLGKLKFLFQETKDLSVEKSYNAIGSAINDLGANGVASEANITEFATRLGSLPDVLKPSIKEALALGAAFEESGIEAEVSSRAYNIFMKQASTESAKFAQVMGISKKAVEDMINTNPLDFMMQFAQGMKGMDATETAKTLDFLGVNADGANKVIGAMGNNMNRFRELIDISNNSFSEGTSLINEYNVKNNNLAATLEKISKTVSGWFSSETFIKWLSASVLWLAKFIGATEDTDGTVSRWKNNLISLIKIISVAVVGFTSYSAALRLIALLQNGVTGATTLLTIAQKANALSGGTLKAVYLGLQYVFYTLTLQEDRATAAMIRFNLATKMNPIGLLVGLVMAAVAAYVIFNKEVDKSIINQKNLNEVKANAQKAVAEEKAALEQLLIIARDKNQSDATREAAIKRINAISPEYLGNISLETINTDKATTAINKYLEALDLKAMKEAFAAKRADLSKNVIDARSNEELSVYDAWYNTDKAKIDFKKFLEMEVSNIEQFKKKTKGWNAPTVESYNAYKLSIKQAKDQLKALSDEEKKFIDKNATLYVTPPNPTETNFKVPGDETSETKVKKNPNSSQEEINRLRVESDSRYNDILLKNRRQLEDDKIAAMQDGYQKELAIENLRYQREIEDLERQKVHTEEMAKMDEEIAKAKEAGDITKYNALISIKNEWKKRNELIDTQINQIQEGKLRIHNQKLGIIYENAEKARIENFQKQFEREKLLRETDFNNQLAALGNNEVAKAELKKAYDLKELEITEKHLQKLVNLYKTNVALDNAFNLLTPAQKDKLQKDLDFALNALSKIKAAKAGETDNNDLKAAARSVFGQTDILGFTSNQWESTFNNLKTLEGQLQAVNMVVSGLQNMWSTYANFQTASENRNLKTFEVNSDKKKARLKRQLDAGYINQATYDKQIKRIDDEYEKRKLEIEYKQAKREKAQALFGAIVNTAKGITAAIPNPFLMSLAAIVGGLQIATIAKTPLPARGYEEGLYPVKREQDGKIFQSRFGGKTKSGLVTKPTYFLTGENGPEMIIDSRAYSQISPETKNALLRELRGIKGFENGMYNQSSQRFEVPAGSTPSSSSNSDRLLEMALVVIAENTAVMKDLRDKPIKALVDKDDKRSMKNIKEGVDDYNDFRNKNKF
ncbi:phage tail tape measure protein [Flavobacterium koreense]